MPMIKVVLSSNYGGHMNSRTYLPEYLRKRKPHHTPWKHWCEHWRRMVNRFDSEVELRIANERLPHEFVIALVELWRKEHEV